MRLAFLGTPDIAVPPLRAITAEGHDLAMAVTAADKRRGRGSALSPSPVKEAARELGIPVTDRVEDLLGLAPPVELGVVVAFGRIIKPHVLARVPMVNLHFSLLPRWRGAAPVERAILAGDSSTGVCVMQVEEGLDTGGTYACEEVPIGPDATAEELRAELVQRGTSLLVAVLREGLGSPRPQVGEPTYASKIDPAELRIDWARPAEEIHRLVRAGGAWTTHEGRRLKIWRSRLDDAGRLEVLEVQPEGKARMSFEAWANGARWRPGDPLGT